MNGVIIFGAWIALLLGVNPDSRELRWTKGGKEPGWPFQALARHVPQTWGEQVDAAALQDL